MCLTNNSHSHAYWNIYSPEGHGVRLRLRTSELFKLVSAKKEKSWFGRLNYEFEKDIKNHLKSTIGLQKSLDNKDPDNLFLNVFHKKRMPFMYENESRISILTNNEGKDGIYKLNFTPQKLISQLYLDPHMGNNEVKAWKEYLLKFNIPVTRSLLLKDQIHKIK
ncbi:DUF2971 domain-containing protein [Cellulophaga baltica]|uniref:DUF2971 domain-containing protein n=1 Tax=Cellulophaga baltica TaxID=76594 RepID=UPI00040BE418|nr:DUF2971 domain-containing protein [Cellulophaga baltica]AIY14339.1 hypothetical protein M667_14745 [Cellulophaga baltica NN016038]